MEKLIFNIIANGVWGPEGLSGGDSIFINFTKNLQKLGHEVKIFTWEDGYELCLNHNLKNTTFVLWPARKFNLLGFSGLYFFRTLKGCWEALKARKSTLNENTIIYSASDFWPDSLPALLMSRKLHAKWIAGMYLFAPNPMRGFRNKKGIRIPNVVDLLFWLSQKPILWLITKYAAFVCVTSDPDITPFVKMGRKKNEVLVVKGGIDYRHLKKFQKPIKKEYDGVFVGRFHPQKGVVEMIDIWNKVVENIPDAKLAVIGIGPMEKEIRKRVKNHGLEKNVRFLGPLIADEKNTILQKSKIFLHPVLYDSGGMAPADGLACGLPGVCFDLPVFKTYYPRGFLYATIGNISDFAQKVIALLKNRKFYLRLSREAIEEAKSWDWETRTKVFVERAIKV